MNMDASRYLYDLTNAAQYFNIDLIVCKTFHTRAYSLDFSIIPSPIDSKNKLFKVNLSHLIYPEQ